MVIAYRISSTSLGVFSAAEMVIHYQNDTVAKQVSPHPKTHYHRRNLTLNHLETVTVLALTTLGQ
jgi:hypothetical protein